MKRTKHYYTEEEYIFSEGEVCKYGLKNMFDKLVDSNVFEKQGSYLLNYTHDPKSCIQSVDVEKIVVTPESPYMCRITPAEMYSRIHEIFRDDPNQLKQFLIDTILPTLKN